MFVFDGISAILSIRCFRFFLCPSLYRSLSLPRQSPPPSPLLHPYLLRAVPDALSPFLTILSAPSDGGTVSQPHPSIHAHAPCSPRPLHLQNPQQRVHCISHGLRSQVRRLSFTVAAITRAHIKSASVPQKRKEPHPSSPARPKEPERTSSNSRSGTDPGTNQSPSPTDEYASGRIICETCGEGISIRDESTGGFTVKHWEAHRNQWYAPHPAS